MRPLRGIVMIVLAVGLFAVMNSLIKSAPRVPAGEAVFFRSAFALPVIIVWLWSRGHLPGGLAAGHWRWHALRGIAGTVAMGLSFLGLKFLPFPEVTALRFVTPVLVLIFAAIFLGERFRLVRLGAVIAGLAGVLIMLWPRFEGAADAAGRRALIGAMIVLTSASFAAIAQIALKRMSGMEKTAAIVFWFSLISMTLGLATLPFGWVWPTPREAGFLICAGILGGAGQMLLTESYRFADVSTLAPFTYVSMIWALLIGYFIFNEPPTIPMLAGAALIIASGLVIAWREQRHQRREREKPRPRGQFRPE